MAKLTVAVLGATGRVGGWVLEECLERHENFSSVKVLSRSKAKLEAYSEKELLTIIEGDATNEEDVSNLLDGGVDVIIAALGSPSKHKVIMKECAETLVKVLLPMDKKIPRVIWMTSTGINEATEQAKMYSMWGSPNKLFFGYGFFGLLQFKILIKFVIGWPLWNDMAHSEDVIRGENSISEKTVLVRPTNMYPPSEHKVFSEEWRKEGGSNLEYQFVKADDPPPGKWMVRKAIAIALVDLATKDNSHDGSAVSLFQKGVAK